MNILNGAKRLLVENLDAHPLWRLNDEIMTYFPIYTFDDVPEEGYNFYIRAEFTTPKGIKIKGYLVSVTDIYCIVIFYNSEIYIFNNNLLEDCFEITNKLIIEINSETTKEVFDVFPLKYTTTIDLPGWKNISGEFDAFEQLKENRNARWDI
jgi:hypothetical protein